MVVELAVIVSMIVIVVIAVAVRMTVATQHKEAKKVGEETGASNNEDEFRVVDFGRFDESRQSFEHDGYAKRNQEDCVEECSQDLCSNPLRYRLVSGNTEVC
jgi:competence protein ComGC